MPYLVFLGQMFEKNGGGFAVGIFSEMLVLSWDTCMFSLVVFKCLGKFLVNFTDTHISLLDTVYNREIWVFVGKYVGRQGELTCSIRTCKFPFYLSPSFRYWREAYH